MLKFMRKIPGGMLLIPMLISALFATFLPDIFKIGGMTEAFFTTKGINYIVALVCFCSSAALDFEKIKKVLKKQGSILLVKVILCFVFSILFFRFFGMEAIWGISAIAFTTTICSLNPSL